MGGRAGSRAPAVGAVRRVPIAEQRELDLDQQLGRVTEARERFTEAADQAAGNRATHAHVATEEGEAFATRSGDLAMVAVASRFALASLVLADMRAALREARASEPPAAAKAEAA